jgi:hypothetical protein
MVVLIVISSLVIGLIQPIVGLLSLLSYFFVNWLKPNANSSKIKANTCAAMMAWFGPISAWLVYSNSFSVTNPDWAEYGFLALINFVFFPILTYFIVYIFWSAINFFKGQTLKHSSDIETNQTNQTKQTNQTNDIPAEYYSLAKRELDRDEPKEDIWAKAYALTEEIESAEKLYIKIRAEQIFLKNK